MWLISFYIEKNPVISTRFSHTFFIEHVFSIFPIGFPVHTDKLYHKPISLSAQPLQLPKATDLILLSETASNGIQKAREINQVKDQIFCKPINSHPMSHLWSFRKKHPDRFNSKNIESHRSKCNHINLFGVTRSPNNTAAR